MKSPITFSLCSVPEKKTMASLDDSDSCEGIRCSRGRCIPILQVCDGVKNCEDGKDESEEACYKKYTICDRDPYHIGCGKVHYYPLLLNKSILRVGAISQYNRYLYQKT